MRLPEKITVWNIYENNSGNGDKSFEEPVTISARIAYVDDQITDRNGDSYTSTASVYFESDVVNERSIIFLGVSTCLEPDGKTYKPVKFAQTPSGTRMKKVWL